MVKWYSLYQFVYFLDNGVHDNYYKVYWEINQYWFAFYERLKYAKKVN